MPYDMIEHRHRVAVWAAARAASRGARGITVVQAFDWIEEVGLKALLQGWEALPSPEAFDEAHRLWCENMIAFSNRNPPLTYGSAAKLINMYLKVAVVCASYEADGEVAQAGRASIGAVHPPIDGYLLRKLSQKNCVSVETRAIFRNLKWSRMGHCQYVDVISRIREILSQEPIEFWRIEKYWDGYSPARSEV